MFKCIGNCSQCGRCFRDGLQQSAGERKTKLLQLPEDFCAEISGTGYGVAFDIGTTTVVGMLWNLQGSELAGTEAMTNPQSKYGQDVISRITFAAQKPENRMLLQKEITDCMNRIIQKLCDDCQADPMHITRATVCGNTTMSHLFAGYDPQSLSRAPFEPAYRGALHLTASDTDIQIAPDAGILVIPNIAGHVGGDITAGILASRLDRRAGKTLLVDIGTNGEIVYHENGRMFACSTAAGPAFEGATIVQGMRAAAGAIERIVITEEDVQFQVVGQVPPVGICGSGLIDAIAEMVRTGIIDATGRIAAADDYGKEHPESPLADRIREGDHGREFVLVARENHEDIVITQQDVREVQLAKGAIAAGIQILTKKAGSTPEELDRIIIAGAFGNYIDHHSAMGIGLLPKLPGDRITMAGNTAGAGALMCAASAKAAAEVQTIPSHVEHVELAEDPDFQDTYILSMGF